MNAMLTAVVQDKMNRYDTVRRKNAEQAYTTQSTMKDSNEALVKRLEALLLGYVTEEEAAETIQQHEQLRAGQMKRVALPLGQTLEETIQTWGKERSEVLERGELSKDAALLGTASSAMRAAESVIALHNLARTLSRQPWVMPSMPSNVRSYESMATQTYSTHQRLLDLPYRPNIERVA